MEWIIAKLRMMPHESEEAVLKSRHPQREVTDNRLAPPAIIGCLQAFLLQNDPYTEIIFSRYTNNIRLPGENCGICAAQPNREAI